MKKAVLLLSSGLDSAANLALCETAGFQVALALTIDYGQRGARKELEHAAYLAQRYRVEHVTFDLRAFSSLIGTDSALMGGQDVPSPESLDDLRVTTQSATAVWVPNRNGVMISVAAALAESRGLQAVAVGFNAEEALTFPDNTPAYMNAMTGSLGFSTANKIEVVSATVDFTKSEIVAKLASGVDRSVVQEFPFESLWSCYRAGSSHCGRCESCQRLRRAIEASLAGSVRERALKGLF